MFLLDATRHVRFSAIIFRLPIFLFVHGQECSCAFLSATHKYCQVLFIFFFSGRLCRNRYCTFLDFQNRFDKVCRIVFRFVRRSAVRSPASCEIGNGTYSWKFAPAISPVSLQAPKDGIRLPQSVTYLPYPFPHRMAFLLSLGKGSAREIPFFL